MKTSNNNTHQTNLSPLPSGGVGGGLLGARGGLLFFLLCILLPLCAQPQKARQAALTLTTYRADGTQIAQTPGVFTSKDGTALAAWRPFKDAARAEVRDSRGRTFEVSCIYGASELYNVARFRVSGITDAATLTPASTPQRQGTAVYVMAAQPQKTAVSRTEQFDTRYTYTVLESLTAQDVRQNPDHYDGAAVVNDKGDLIGLYNYSSSVQSATDARYVDAFRTSALSASDPVLRQTGLRMALPPAQQDAQLALMLAANQGSQRQEATARDYVAAFPTAADGYYSLAAALAAQQRPDEADRTMQQAVSRAADKAEAHFDYSRLITAWLSTPMDSDATPFFAWTWEKARAEADAAIAANALPIYRQQRAETLLGQQKWQAAYDEFLTLANEGKLGGEPFYKAFVAKAQLNAPDAELLDLLDRAIAASDTAYAATYFYARGMLHDQNARYREAMRDYIVYENLAYPNLSGAFYYQREQCERRGKFYQPALQDIAHAVLLDVRNAEYWGEMASLNLQVGKHADALQAAEGCLKLVPDQPEALLIKGICQCELGQKAEGRQHLARAQELGNTQAAAFLEKYK